MIMNKRRLGRTNLSATEIGAGCWAIGGSFINLGLAGGWDNVNEEDALKGLFTAAEMGVNIFDTADVYGLGQSERLLGVLFEKLLKNGISRRCENIIISKVGYFKGCAPHGFDPLHMRHQLEMTLQNLGVDFLDIYFFHHLDFGNNDMYLEGALNEMRNFKKAGLINFIGLRGPHQFSLYRQKGGQFSGKKDRFLRLTEIIDPDVISLRYNMITPSYDRPESDLFKWAEERDLGILLYKPLGQGLLLDKYDIENSPTFGPGDHRTRKAWYGKKGLGILKERLSVIKEKFGCKSREDLVHLAIKYCLSRSKSACVFVGFRNTQQIRESLSTQGYLSEEECDYIRNIFEGIGQAIGDFVNIEGD